jgi:HK97 family phage major capsid protein
MKITWFGAAFAAVAIACVAFALHPDMPPALAALHPAPSALIAMQLALGVAPAIQIPRGVRRVRADGTDATKILNELKITFEAFKAEHTKELADLKKGMGDVVQSEKVEKINAEISELTKSLDEINKLIAAAKLGGGGNNLLNPAQAEHAKAFDAYFRKGVEGNLRDLEVKAALTTQSNPDGGYLTSVETEKTIDRVLGVVSVFRQLARVIAIGSATYKKPVNMGGATSGWVGEEEARPDTNTPSLRELEFPVMELYAKPAATQTMLDDGVIDIGQWLADEVAITFAEQEGAAFLTGNGIRKPRGMLDYSKVANSAYAWGSIGYMPTGQAAAFATAPGDTFIELYYALRQGYRGNASWLMSDATMASVRKFKDGQGNYIWSLPSGPAELPTILGKSVYTDDNMPAVGANAYPVAFGDYKRAYLILDRVGIRVLRDPYSNKPYVQFYTTKRVGGGLQNFEAVKLMKIATS